MSNFDASFQKAIAAAHYLEAKATRDALEKEVREAGKVLKAFPKTTEGLKGLTPDSVRESPEYRKARTTYDRLFAKLQSFNATFTTKYAKEIRAERTTRGR